MPYLVILIAATLLSGMLLRKANATAAPIEFEPPLYSTTVDFGSVNVAGSIYQQDGWQSMNPFGVGGIAVTDQNPIVGLQSLRVPANSNSNTRAQASGL